MSFDYSGNVSVEVFEAQYGLPDPRGSLSNSVSSRAISRANVEVEAGLERQKKENGEKKEAPIEGTWVSSISISIIKIASYVHLATKFHTLPLKSELRLEGMHN